MKIHYGFMIISLTITPSVAQDTVIEFTSKLSPDGSIEIIEKSDSTENLSNAVVADIDRAKIGDQNSIASEKLDQLLNRQDWFVGTDPSGELKAIYTVPKGTSLMSDAFASADVGDTVTKVNWGGIAASLFPEKEVVRKQLLEFVNQTRQTVCEFEFKPSEFESSVDISPAWGAAGKITFKAKWTSLELCG